MKDDDIIPLILKGRDVPCPRCSYNLRGAANAVCPECGERLYLHNQSVCVQDRLPDAATPTRVVNFRFGMTGLVLGEILLFFVGFSSMNGIPNGSEWQALVFLTLLFLHPALVVLGLKYREDVLRWSSGRQYWALLLCWWWLLLPLLFVLAMALVGLGVLIRGL